MKKWNNIIFLVLSMLVVGCGDNDENPVGFYTSSGGDRIEGFSASVGESWLRAGGGSGVYKVSSSDESIVRAELSQEVITLKAYKVGQAEITIVDSREESATIEITVCPLIRTIEVMETRAFIRYSDGRDTSDVEEKVKKEIIENMDIAKGWQFKMVYDHWNGAYEREGKVTVYQDASQEEGIEGTYSMGNVENKIAYTFKYEDREHILQFPEILESGIARDTGPQKMTRIEKYSAEYKEKYPDANFKEVVCILRVAIWRR